MADKGLKKLQLGSRLLVTGSHGFIGKRVVACLLEQGFTNIACLTRRQVDAGRYLDEVGGRGAEGKVELIQGDLLSRGDCVRAAAGARIIFHLAAGRGEKSFADAYLNSVVVTRNLLEACLVNEIKPRFVNVSSFTVYTNSDKPRGSILDEACPLETEPALRFDPYCFAKVKQEELVVEYAKKHGIPYTVIRPGVVYGPGNENLHGRVGIGTFGVFLHLGGLNRIPLSYVDNCAEAIVLAGTTAGVEGEAFNIVDDDLPTSHSLLRMYKRQVRPFHSIYLPHWISYACCYLWEKYSAWSHNQLPPTFNRRMWRVYWKRTRYSNEKAKRMLGWRQRVPTEDGLKRYLESARRKVDHA